MSTRGHCQYRFNPSETYKRTKPGMGVETCCGAATYPAVDEPELGSVRHLDGTIEYRRTGRLIERTHPDPYCPAHGGSPEPPPPPVTQAELEQAYAYYAALMTRFQEQHQPALDAAPVETVPLPVAEPVYAPLAPSPAATPAGVSPEQLAAAAQGLARLAAQAQAQQEVTGVR